MTESETHWVPRPGLEMNHDFATEVFLPEDKQNFGENDPISDIIYDSMIGTESAEPLIDLIDLSRDFINIDFENVRNQLAIDRLLALVRDVPEKVSVVERQRLWEHLLAADWIHTYASPGSLEEAAFDMLDNNLDFVPPLQASVATVLSEKLAKFSETVGFSEHVTSPYPWNEDDSDAREKSFYHIRDTTPEALDLYSAVIELSSLSQNMQVRYSDVN